MNTVQCPHCKKQVELSEAIMHEFQDKIRDEEKKNLKAQFDREKAEEQAEHEKKLRFEFEQKNKDQVKALEEIKKKEEESLQREKALLASIEKEKEEREKAEAIIKQEAQKKAAADVELQIKQKDIQLEQVRKANQDLQRKLEQGSQQLQGEALELNLEEKLKEAFPTDEFVPIPKGVEGGDIWQKIRFKNQIVGSILWETKRTKSWSKDWLVKVKDDMAKVNASEAIIVSQVLPQGSTNFDRKDGVWITTYEHALNICRYVRFLVTTIASVKSSTDHTEEEWGMIRDYMMSDAFKHRMQSHFDTVNLLRISLTAEKRATTIRWKKQESLIEKLDRNTLNFYGELKTIVANLPELEGGETLLLADEKMEQGEAEF